MVTCPNSDCAREIVPDTDGRNARIAETDGLCPIRCAHCGHAGFLATGGLHLVFHAGQEFCFIVGTTPAPLTMVVPVETLYAYQWLGLSLEALARHAAEWLLLLGYKAGVFTLSQEQPAFAGFTHYVESRVPKLRTHVA